MLNVCTLTGRLVKEVDLRYTSNGKAVGSFTLAVDRQFKNAHGEKETDFINAVIWGKSAEALVNFTKKRQLNRHHWTITGTHIRKQRRKKSMGNRGSRRKLYFPRIQK